MGAFASILDLARKVWQSINTIWAFLVQIGTILTGAWDWMVNGVSWFTEQVSDWAASVYTTTWHTLTSVIPKAAEWAFRQATSWAGTALHTAERFLSGLIHSLRQWSERELAGLTHTVRGWFTSILRFVTGPVEWVLHTGRHIANLVLNPQALAEWVVGSLIEPLVTWFLRSGSHVLIWLLRKVIHESSEVAHMLEELIERVV